MQTNFTDAQLEQPDTHAANNILRACVHCGFCTATCPTYILTGDERDGPRGRIYLIKDMLENDIAPANAVTHIDRCLSCLGCVTTCPSGVDYMHLVDHARSHIETKFRRPLADRLLRALIASILPHRARFRIALRLGRLARPFVSLLPGKLRAMVALLPSEGGKIPRRETGGTIYQATGDRRKRVALLAGCVQRDLAPRINAATISLLTRHGCEVVVPTDVGCCGAITHHMGRENPSLRAIRANVAAWSREIENHGLDAIVINASGCGTMVKDYGHVLRHDPEWAEKAGQVSALACDISEIAQSLDLKNPPKSSGLAVAYHSACSLRHGQKIHGGPQDLLTKAGFWLSEPAESHLCCGSAGVYNILQPEFAAQLGDRKAATLTSLDADVVATGNIGCMIQLAGRLDIPVLHSVELLDWATGGQRPENIGN
jgi:glycolate oxidase iron-sulfur subunit